MSLLPSSLRGALVFIMLSCVLSRSLCQVVTEVNRRSYPTYASVFRAFTTSSPKTGEPPNNADSVVKLNGLKNVYSVFLFETESLVDSGIFVSNGRQWCVSGESSSLFSQPKTATLTSTKLTQRTIKSMDGSVVTYSQLKTMLSSRDIQLFDVRNPDEYQAGRIADAVNIPLGNLEDALKLSPEHFQQKFQVRAPGKDDDNIVLYCRSGNRSAKALEIARQLGYNRARHYKGGYSEWAEQEGK